MGKIFYIMGKSASGKDSLYKWLLTREELGLQRIILYTTRPVRNGEEQGREYYFVDEGRFHQFEQEHKVIECRSYQTVHGIWTYFTADDGQIDLGHHDYLGIGTLESFGKMKEYFGENNVYPIYVEVEDGERLARALKREKKQTNPKYAEMCRRFLADCVDFSEEKLKEAGVEQRFMNDDREACFGEIESYIKSMLY